MSESLNARSEAVMQVELERCYNRAKRILSQNKVFLEKIAEAFIEKKTLLYSDIQRIRSAVEKGDSEAVHVTTLQDFGMDDLPEEEPEESEEVIRQRIKHKLDAWRQKQKR